MADIGVGPSIIFIIITSVQTEHLESLKWHFLHSEKAKCLILQFVNNKI